MTLVMALNLLVVLYCVSVVAYIVVSVVRIIRQGRRNEAMLAEYRTLTQELVELQQQFVQKYNQLSDEERAKLWQPVADEVAKSIECLLDAIRAGVLRDPRPDIIRSIELARALVQAELPAKPE